MPSAKYQYQLFMLALSFFSRIPVPASIPYSEERMNQAGRYFALVGLLLGSLCALVYCLASSVLPASVAIIIMMVFSLMLTGAFHEDGLTDMADGIGGGMTLERRLTIMKDSRIGTYGASALVMALLGKYVLLSELVAFERIALFIIVAYTLSRAVAASLIYDMPYVSDADASKSKPLAQQQSKLELAVLLATGVMPCVLLGLPLTITLVIVVTVFRFLFKRWLLARIGGFTGDCLGAAQQLSELLIYLTLIAWMVNGV
ncbi:cobalamin synthase [Vibrio orientalis CIP 102891 = ATCC 33934]|uniref:Adenosylcobinamide-GDP ribazoletransferase n=1 Tax=Vibrio orientalis CIP 102891 = ATCC 33934 TaxID=675816 RepID=C9QHQ5_VIBOR|nr:adenosylcobinamide-GDP ribazoletransferase [Vibrio orientalis]EEX92226.1 cobalamin synthase [Vibrio orientalis CIP 102891 = ATCC 33934]EGU53263.1 cobalamin synthase [Vibrio orientalis CIP 102891 = ATCC 33934]